MGCLKNAADAGFFLETANRTTAANDSDLAILFKRDEFRNLIGRDVVKP